MAQYIIWNGPVPTTDSQAPVTTGTAIKTMLQVKSVTGVRIKVKAWGLSMDGAAAAAGVQWSLLTTGTVAATVTAHSDATILGWDSDGLATAASTFLAYTTTGTGYTSSAEGTITTTRVLQSSFTQPTGERVWEFSLGQEPVIVAANILRIRCKAAAAVNALCWVIVEV